MLYLKKDWKNNTQFTAVQATMKRTFDFHQEEMKEKMNKEERKKERKRRRKKKEERRKKKEKKKEGRKKEEERRSEKSFFPYEISTELITFGPSLTIQFSKLILHSGLCFSCTPSLLMKVPGSRFNDAMAEVLKERKKKKREKLCKKKREKN